MTGVNVGLMAFNTSGSANEGGHMLLPIGDIDTNRSQFITQVNAMTPYTWTPLAESLFEGLRYYEGERPFLDRSPIASVMSGSYYDSPIQNECQSNNIVVLTDGEPTYDADPTSRYYDSSTDGRNHNTIEAKVGNCSGNCLDEISKYMATRDITSKYTGDQHINTYTVGFDINNSLLKNTAINGGGADQYYLANDAESLENAFNAIVRKVLATSTTFVAPGIAVNTFNRLNHLDTLYFSVFEPRLEPNWQGNLKRYQLASGGIVTDADGEEAVDDSTGFFKRSSRSWWSATEDGPDVASGGASYKHKDANADRKVYTYYSGSASRQLTNSANAVSVANKANITKAMFGDAAMSDATHEQLINWTRGADVFDEDGDGSTTDSRHFISDPLHSKPHLLIYGGSSASPDVSVFFGDNQGFLHAIDGNTGETHFSFIPEELLENQQILMDNSADSDRTYGIDGSVASWQYDQNKDGTISGSDHVYIYFGMRRGGNNYYALDVTNRNSPEVLFTIEGGTGDFKELGQTWSKPVKTK
ncbi:MAG: pilus assembly protein PilY, partial [Pseudomonadales bacterium]|nr:pilus assembly protein PilY [Pseudomonadales bacterium]